MFKNKKIIISSAVFLGFIIILSFSLFPRPQAQEITESPTATHDPIKETAQRPPQVKEIILKNDQLGEMSVYDFMTNLKNTGKINFTDKTYTGMGKLITSINGRENKGTKNWIYYVNGKEAEVGVSNYKVNRGDIISWKYE